MKRAVAAPRCQHVRGIGQVRDHRTHPAAQTRPHTSGVRITTGIVLVVFL
jgi:hypothetical protein